MKKSFVTSILLLYLFSFGLSAQIGLDLSFGVNNSNVNKVLIQKVNTSSKNGYFLGIAQTYILNSKIKTLVNIQYSQKGYTEILSLFGDRVHEHRINYFDVIPELEYSLSNFLSLALGANIGLNTTYNAKVGTSEWKTVENKIVTNSDFGLTGKLKISTRKFFTFVRYNHGLSDINAIDFREPIGSVDLSNIKMLNRNFQLGVGYSL